MAQPATGKLWGSPSTGAILAARQLHKNLHKGGRKRKTLPGGGKLQPLFKNFTGPPPAENSPFKVLPNIGSPITDQETLIKHVMSGKLTHLPEPTKTTIRVFLASNYDDMKEERNMLLTQAVPEIQEFCSQYGLHFQLIDLNWAVDEEILSNDMSLGSVHQREIAECQRLSLAPNFMVLLGDKYGQGSVVNEIPVEEFDVLYTIAMERDIEGTDLLCQSYCKDTNASEPVYRIHVTDEEAFDAVQLRTVVQKCAEIACEQNKMTDAQKRKYFVSSLEEDILQGIVRTKDPRRQCLCYRREFQNFKQHLNSPGIADYFDVIETGNEHVLNKDMHSATVRLADLASKHLGAGNFKPYFLPWTEQGMSTEREEFQQYLSRLRHDCVADVCNMVKIHAEKLVKGSGKVENVTLQEAIYHANLCIKYQRHFQGQTQLLAAIQRFLRNPRVNNKPFVVYGESGTGKSAVMAKLVSEIQGWFTHNTVVVYRVLGSTSESSSIFRVIVSITHQICLAYGLALPNINVDCSTLYKALVTFRRVITEVSKSHAFVAPLYILLDGIHSLQPQDESMRALWAIRDLPPNVHIITSTVPKLGNANLITGMVQLVSDSHCSMEVDDLTMDEAKQLIRAEFTDHNRKLTDAQERMILETFAKFKQPLLLNTIIAHALEWGSYLKQSEADVPLSAEEYLSRCLDELEEQFGGLLIMSLVSYITTSPVGIHERELIDLLLADQDVEDDMNQFPKSIVKSLRYLPAYLTSTVKFKLRHFLTNHLLEGKSVLAWSHRLFCAAAAQKYQVIYQGIDEARITDDSTSYTLMLHENITNMYLKEHTRFTISSVDGKSKTAPTTSEGGSVALTHPQPVNVYNQLKLARVPVSLQVMTPVEGLSRAKEAVLFNFEWLQTKMKSKPVHFVMNDLLAIISITDHVAEEQQLSEASDKQDMRILFETLQLAKRALDEDAEYLAAELYARLPRFVTSHEWISKLLNNATAYIQQQRKSAMLPLAPCFKEPQALLRHTMHGPTHILGFLQQGQTTVMFSQANGVDVWLNSTGELLHRFSVNPEQKLDKIICGHNAEFVLIGHYSHLNHQMELNVVSSETGVQLVNSLYPQNFEAVALNEHDNLLVVSTTVNDVSDDQTPTKCLLGVDVQTKEVMYTIAVQDIHEDGVTKLMFIRGETDDQNYLLTIGSKKSQDLGLWDLERECLEFKMLLNVFVDHVQLCGSMAVCGSSRQGVLLFIDLNEGKLLRRIDETDLVDMSDMLVSNQGQHVCVATAEMGINIYSVEEAKVTKTVGERLETTDGKCVPPSQLCADEQERFLFVGYCDGQIVVHWIASGQVVLKLNDQGEGHTCRINSLRMRDGILFSSAQNHEAKVWNLKERLDQFSIDITKVNKSASNLDGIQQFSEEINKVSVDTSTSTTMNLLSAGKDICDVIMSSDDKQVITCSPSGPIRIWNTDTGVVKQTITSGCEHGATRVYLACKDTLLIGHCKQPGIATSNVLRVWRVNSGEAVKLDDELQVYSSCLLPGEQTLLTVSPSKDNRQAGMVFTIVDLFELKCTTTLHCSIFGSMDSTNLHFIGAKKFIGYKPTRRPVHTSTTSSQLASKHDLEQGDAIIVVLDFFPDDKTSYFFSIRLSGENFEEINMDYNEPIHVDSCSPQCSLMLDGARCVTGQVNGAILLWDSATQKRLDNLYDRQLYQTSKSQGTKGRPAHAGCVTSLSINTTGTLLLSGGSDGFVKVWNLAMKTLVQAVQPHNSSVLSMTLSGNNEILLSGASEPELQLTVLNPRAAQQACCFYTHSKLVSRVHLTADRKRVVLLAHDDHTQLIVLQTMFV